MRIAILASLARETLVDAVKVVTSKDGVKTLYGVSFYRNAIYLILRSMAIAVTGFIFWIVAARLYSASDVGIGSAAISAATLLVLLSTLGLDYGLIRFLPASGDKANDIINSCFTIGGLMSIALSIIFVAGLGIWSPALLPIRDQAVFLICFVVFTIGFTLMTFANQTFIAERRAGFALTQSLIFNLLRFIPLVVLASVFPTFGIFGSWGVATLVAVVAGVFLFLPRIQSGFHPFPLVKKEVINEMMHFSFANYVGNIFWMLPGLVLPLMVINILSAESNAYFYIGWTAGGILGMIPGAFSLSLFAEGSYEEEGLAFNIWRSLKITAIILIPAVILVVLIADKLLLLFGSTYSQNATTLLRIMAISTLPLAINAVYVATKRVENRLTAITGLTAFIAVATLGLAYLLLPRMGINGTGIAYLVSQSTAALWIVVSRLKRYRPAILPGKAS